MQIGDMPYGSIWGQNKQRAVIVRNQDGGALLEGGSGVGKVFMRL